MRAGSPSKQAPTPCHLVATPRYIAPCVRGTRISVGDVLGYLAGGMSEAQILADFPQLTSDDVRACLAYAAERERRTVSTPAA